MTTGYHSVTETCRLLKVRPHTLRYWEKEFDLKVKRNSAGRRIYSDNQLEKLRLVHRLIREEKLTVKGARRKLALMAAPRQQSLDLEDGHQQLLWVRKELIAIRGLLVPEEKPTAPERGASGVLGQLKQPGRKGRPKRPRPPKR